MSANGRVLPSQALVKLGDAGDGEVVPVTYEEPWRSLSCITRRVSQDLRRCNRLWHSECNRTGCTSQSERREDVESFCAGMGRLTLMIASLIMSAVYTRQRLANTIKAISRRRDKGREQETKLKTYQGRMGGWRWQPSWRRPMRSSLEAWRLI